MEPIGCPETSVRNYNCALRSDAEERMSHNSNLCRRIKTHISRVPYSTSKLGQATLPVVPGCDLGWDTDCRGYVYRGFAQSLQEK